MRTAKVSRNLQKGRRSEIDILPLADSIPALIHTAREAKGGCPERQVPLRG